MRSILLITLFFLSSIQCGDKQHILVTGGAGYIGSHVAKALADEGYIPVIFDNFSTGYLENCKWGYCIQGDLSDLEQLEAAFEAFPISAVCHLAASIKVDESVRDPEKYYMNNFVNTLYLLAAMKNHGVKHLVFSSTAAIYPTTNTLDPIKETIPGAPANPYGKTKLFVEEVLSDYQTAYDFDYVTLRFFNVAGIAIDQSILRNIETPSHFIDHIFHVACKKQPVLKLYGHDYPTADGFPTRDFVHVEDIARAYILSLHYLENGGASETFNIGTSNGFSIYEVLKEAKKIVGEDIPYEITDRRPGDVAISIADVQKAKEILGFEPKHSDLTMIMKNMWEYYHTNMASNH